MFFLEKAIILRNARVPFLRGNSHFDVLLAYDTSLHFCQLRYNMVMKIITAVIRNMKTVADNLKQKSISVSVKI